MSGSISFDPPVHKHLGCVMLCVCVGLSVTRISNIKYIQWVGSTLCSSPAGGRGFAK